MPTTCWSMQDDVRTQRKRDEKTADMNTRKLGSTKKEQTSPVDCCPREATQHSQVGEASLVQHNQHGQTNGNSQALLNPSKHHSEPGSIEHNPVELVHLRMRCETEQDFKARAEHNALRNIRAYQRLSKLCSQHHRPELSQLERCKAPPGKAAQHGLQSRHSTAQRSMHSAVCSPSTGRTTRCS